MKVRDLILAIALVILYFGAAKLGLSLAFLHASVSPVWPPTGVAIAIVLWLGYRFAPTILIGAFLANLATSVPIATAAGIAAGNTLEAVCAAFLVQRLVGSRIPFSRAQDVWKFVFIAGLLSPMISATIGNVSLCLSNAAQWSNFNTLWLTWWLGDGSGALAVAPFLLTWLAAPGERWSPRRLGEALLLLAVLLLVAYVVFGGLAPTRAANYPLGHLTIPILLWAGFRFGPRGASTAIVALSGVAILGTTRGLGPFAEQNLNESLLLLQVFVVAVATAALVLAGAATEHKRARSDVTFLASIVESSDDAVIGRTPDGIIVSWNKGARKILGHSAEETIGRHISILAPQSTKGTDDILQALKAREQTERVETVWARKDGTLVDISLTISPIRDSAGKTVAFSVIGRDITARKRAEIALRASEDRLRAILDNSTAFIYLKDLDGKYILMNRRCLQTWGFTPETIQGKTDYQLYAREIADAYVANDRKVLEAGAAIQLEEPGYEPDGEHTYLSVKFPLFDANGIPYAVCGVSTDISDLKRAEKEREHLLLSEQAARAAAETANQAKDEFLALVSHELRTPLNAIVGWIEILINTRPDEEVSAHALQVIKRNAELQVKIIEDILDVSRIVTGKLRLEMKPVQIRGIIQAALAAVQPTAEAKHVRVRSTLGQGSDLVLGDSQRLQQVFWNLLSNAIKFTPEGGDVEIAVQHTDPTVKITVSDTGEGISPRFLPHIFDRFRQADSSRTRRHGGLGLGLAIVRHLVELHHGTVEAYSAGEHLGTVFTITLPCERAAFAQADDEGFMDGRTRLLDSTTLSGIRVLIVDDDVDSREVLAAALNLRGAEARTASTAHEALQTWNEWRPNILVSDIGMPDEDGYDLIRQLRNQERADSSCIKAIALTGYASAEDRERVLDAGYQLHLAKPVDTNQLVSFIAAISAANRDEHNGPN